MKQEKIIKYLFGSKNEDRSEMEQNILDDAESLKEYARLKNTKALLASVNDAVSGDIQKNLLKTKIKLGLVNQNKRKLVLEVLKYAAVVLISFSVAFYALDGFKPNTLNGKKYSVEVPYGETANLTLPDGTKVWLNSGSTINYLASYGINTRAVDLVGEAFFSVAKNKKLPFVVETDLLDIEVTGTEFNVTSYPDEDLLYTTLVEGGVTVKSKQGKVLHKLKPAQQAILYKSEKRTEVKQVRSKIFTSWKDGVMRFEDEPLGRIIKDIERWYNVDIQLDDNSLQSILFSGAILKNNPLDDILQIIVESSNVKEYTVVKRDGLKNQIIMK